MPNTIGTVIIDVKADTAKLVAGMDKAQAFMTKSVGNMTDSLKDLAKAYLSFKAVDTFVSAGFEYNRMMEKQVSGMQRMIVATSQDISAKGKQLSLTEKYIMAASEANTTMSELEAINAQTPHTLGQTVQIYNAMYSSMKNAGASQKEMIELTKEISMASSNLDFNSVLAGVDGLATGTVEVSSDFGRFLGSLGLTNEELKKTDNVAKLVHEKLGQMTKSADSMDEATSNLTNSWEKFTGQATEPIFDTVKDDIKSMTKAMNESNQELLDFVYFISLPVAGVHILVNSFRVAFHTIPLYFEDAGLAIKEYWIKLLFELQKSAHDVLPEKMAGMLGFDSKSIGSSKQALSEISSHRSALASQVLKEQELLYKTASAYNNINIQKSKDINIGSDGLLANPKAKKVDKDAEKAAKKAADAAKKAIEENAEWMQKLTDTGYEFAKEHEEKMIEEIKNAHDSVLQYYTDIGDASTVFSIEESDKIQKMASDGILSNEQMLQVWEADQKKYQDDSLANVMSYIDSAQGEWANYFEAIGDYESSWWLKEQQLREQNTQLSADELNKMVSLQKDSYIKQQNDLKDNTIKMKTVFEDAFSEMENSMVEMFKSGKFEADKFFDSIIEGIIRMQIRNSITDPLTKAIGGFDFGSMLSSFFASANGNAFNKGAPVYAFANGGAFTNSVVTSPTVAPMSLFGEAGPEAIMPLTRIGSSLGVKATPSNVVVNIENNSGTPVTQDNVSTSFDGGTMIVNVVLDAISRNKMGARDVIRGVR